jgi:hypothetical protein
MRTVPVKYSAGPLPEGREPDLFISITLSSGFSASAFRVSVSPQHLNSLRISIFSTSLFRVQRQTRRSRYFLQVFALLARALASAKRKCGVSAQLAKNIVDRRVERLQREGLDNYRRVHPLKEKLDGRIVPVAGKENEPFYETGLRLLRHCHLSR